MIFTYISKHNLQCEIWILEELRLHLNYNGRQLKELIEKENLLAYIDDNYDIFHGNIEDGVNSILVNLDYTGDFEASDLKCNIFTIWDYENLINSMCFHLEKDRDYCYMLFISTNEYEMLCNLQTQEWCLSYGAWEDRIYHELNIEVEW